MTKIISDITQLIGNTPLVQLHRISALNNVETPVLAKVEFFNPGGSVKDRIALSMIEAAERNGKLKPGATIIEPTSGNTGVGLAWIAAVKGYKLILFMPENMSVERVKLVKGYGADVRLTSKAEGMAGAVKAANELRAQTEGSITLGQFDNKANPEKHYQTTGPEIWEQTGGKIDVFVAGVGTGGTLSGAGKYLKEQNPNIKIIAIQPATSPVLAGGTPGPHMIQGIGANFIPQNYDANVVDEVVSVDNDAALETARALAKHEGLMVGISSGAAAYTAIELAKRPEFAGKQVVTLLPDTGERYLSTDLFNAL